MATKEEFAKFIFALSRAVPKFAPAFTDHATLDVWYAEFRAVPAAELARVHGEVVRQCDEFPSIKKLTTLLAPVEPSAEDVGRETAERIWAALGRWKSLRTDSAVTARDEYLGETGREVVRLAGGWQQICEVATFDNAATLKAQWRELAATLVRKARAGVPLDRPPSLPRPSGADDPALPPAGSRARAAVDGAVASLAVVRGGGDRGGAR